MDRATVTTLYLAVGGTIGPTATKSISHEVSFHAPRSAARPRAARLSMFIVALRCGNFKIFAEVGATSARAFAALACATLTFPRSGRTLSQIESCRFCHASPCRGRRRQGGFAQKSFVGGVSDPDFVHHHKPLWLHHVASGSETLPTDFWGKARRGWTRPPAGPQVMLWTGPRPPKLVDSALLPA